MKTCEIKKVTDALPVFPFFSLFVNGNIPQNFILFLFLITLFLTIKELWIKLIVFATIQPFDPAKFNR